MGTLKIFLFGMALTLGNSMAATVNFTTIEGYAPGPITNNKDWSGSGSGFSVEPSGWGKLSISNSAKNKRVQFVMSLQAQSRHFLVSIEFSFERKKTNSLSSNANFISVELDQGATSRRNRVALHLQRYKKKPKLYRLVVITAQDDGSSSYLPSKPFGESLLGFARAADRLSDRLELELILKGADPSSWTASCTVRSIQTGAAFHFETGSFGTNSTNFSSDTYPAIGTQHNKAESLVRNKVIHSFRSTVINDPSTKKPNVIFIAVDDLNDWTGLWKGHPNALTPNMDRLARMGLRFTNAHCAVPACNPSRTTVLSGMRAATTGLYMNREKWDESPLLNQTIPLPQRFCNNGYYVAAKGKIFHTPKPEYWDEDGGSSSSAKPPKSQIPLNGLAYPSSTSFDWGALDIQNSEMGDWRTADYIVEKLKEEIDKPFFLACGFIKPHLPWYAPREYFDRFPLDEIVLPGIREDDLNDIPPPGVLMVEKLHDHQKVMAKEGAWKEAVQGYLAATAFTDDCIGRILDALEQHPEKENTIIVLWSDHGWHLGEKLHWRKFALWEEATRVPLVFVVPGMTTPTTETNAPVSLLDIYPTLLELAGLPADPNADGNSLTPLLKDWTSKWSHEAITEHGYMNRSVRTYRWRYILYANGSEELYDHENDPNEWTNLANQTGYENIKGDLKALLPQSYAAPLES